MIKMPNYKKSKPENPEFADERRSSRSRRKEVARLSTKRGREVAGRRRSRG